MQTGAVADLSFGARAKSASGPAAKARSQAQDFESVVLNTMFQSMFTGIGEEGPLGNSTGVGVWRSFLTEEYAKTFAKSGGVGLADHVYSSLLAQQETRAAAPLPGAYRR
jgi:Rod binding domain-containing protein